MRQFGGLLMTFSALITMYTLTSIAGSIAGGNTPNSGKPLFDLIASLCLCLTGVVGVIMGYLTLVQDRGWKLLSGASCVITQLAWLPFLGGLVGVSQGSRNAGSFIPDVFEPTADDTRFVGAMGFLSIVGYAAAFVGSMSFMQFAMFAYHSEKATKQYGSSYYRGRLGYYSFLVFLAGFAQMSLGSYALNKFGKGPYPEPIAVGPLVSTYPEISIFVGVYQLCVSFLGMARSFRLFTMMSTNIFSFICLTLWLIMLVLQIMVQIGYPAGSELVAMAPTLGCFLFAHAFMPAYLDVKASTLPEELGDDYYGGEGQGDTVMGDKHDDEEAAHMEESMEKEGAKEQGEKQAEENVEKVV